MKKQKLRSMKKKTRKHDIYSQNDELRRSNFNHNYVFFANPNQIKRKKKKKYNKKKHTEKEENTFCVKWEKKKRIEKQANERENMVQISFITCTHKNTHTQT